MAVTAPAFEAIGAPAPSNRRRRYTEDQVSIGRVLLRMLGGFIVLAIFVLPYTIMFFGSVKTKAQIRSVESHVPPHGVALGELRQHVVDPETPLPQNLISTIVIAVFATVLVLAVAMPAAYYTARFLPRGASCSSSS